MRITRVLIRLTDREKEIKAFCSVIFNRIIRVDGLKIKYYNDQWSMEMPRRELDIPQQGRGGRVRTHNDIVYPLNRECRAVWQDVLFEAYHTAMEMLERGEIRYGNELTLDFDVELPEYEG